MYFFLAFYYYEYVMPKFAYLLVDIYIVDMLISLHQASGVYSMHFCNDKCPL